MRKFGIALIIALIAVMTMGGVVLADDPTTVTVDWGDGGTGYGTGWVGTTVTAGDDAISTFQTSGNGVRGSFVATDQNDNPYFYNVDTFSAGIDAEVQSGIIEFQTDRTDSEAGMYGSAGQQSYNFVGTDGWGAMATNSWTNYASQKDCCYGHPWTPGGDHFEVAGADTYDIVKYIRAGDGDWAQVHAWQLTPGNGGGQAELDCMNSEMSGGQVKLGRGCGCYTDASFDAVGTGSFVAEAHGNNYAEVCATGWNSYGSSASVSIVAGWVNGGCNIGDYSVTAN